MSYSPHVRLYHLSALKKCGLAGTKSRKENICRHVDDRQLRWPTEDYTLGDSLSERPEELLRRGKRGDQHICDFGEGGTCNQAHISVESCHSSWGTDILVNGFGAFLYGKMQEVGFIKIFSWKYLTIWRLSLLGFPEHRVPHPDLCSVLLFSHCSSWGLNSCRTGWWAAFSISQSFLFWS